MCKTERPLTEFHKDKTKRAGRRACCKHCIKAIRDSSRERIREQLIQWRDANPGYQSAWRKANRHLVWQATYRQRAKEYGFKPVIEQFTAQDLIERYGDACAHCGGEWRQIDHYPVAVALGGSHTLENVRPSCALCNWANSGQIKKQRKALTKERRMLEHECSEEGN